MEKFEVTHSKTGRANYSNQKLRITLQPLFTEDFPQLISRNLFPANFFRDNIPDFIRLTGTALRTVYLNKNLTRTAD